MKCENDNDHFILSEHSSNDIRDFVGMATRDRFDVPQAAALMAQIDPSMLFYYHNGRDQRLYQMPDTTKEQDPRAEKANFLFERLRRSITNNALPCVVDIATFIKNNKDWRAISIKHIDLAYWIIERDICPGIFQITIDFIKIGNEINSRPREIHSQREIEEFEGIKYDIDDNVTNTQDKKTHIRQNISTANDYLNPENPRYAPKLAAAIRAWEEVEEPKGKHPAQAIREWLTSNAKELGLLNGDGTHNKLAIKAISNVINWKPKGGAPKTPG